MICKQMDKENGVPIYGLKCYIYNLLCKKLGFISTSIHTVHPVSLCRRNFNRILHLGSNNRMLTVSLRSKTKLMQPIIIHLTIYINRNVYTYKS